MTFRCDDLDRVLAAGDPEQLAAARAHAQSCAACRRGLDTWDDISAAARAMRRRWDSPSLWPRTAAALSPAVRRSPLSTWWLPVAAAAACLLAIVGTWWIVRQPAAPPSAAEARLLGTRALQDVERAETDYLHALDRLSSVAEPRLDHATSPLLLALRERLLVLDAAIAQCRAEIDRNRYNAHLRRELLEMYREKRQTLEEILNAPDTAS